TNVKGSARVQLLGAAPKVLHDGDNVVELGFDDRTYALFAPQGTTWKRADGAFVCSLGNKNYFAVAALPDPTPETLALFTQHAFPVASWTEASYRYDRASAEIATQFHVTTDVKEGTAREPLLALYRHQWLHSKASFLAQRYVSPRGEMKLLAASDFETRH